MHYFNDGTKWQCGQPLFERGKVNINMLQIYAFGFALGRCSRLFLFPYDHVTRGTSRDPGRGLSFSFRVCSGGAGEEETAYLEVEAVERWAELLPAGQTVLLTAAGHAGEEAEQQEVTEQGFHGAGAGGAVLQHREGGRQLEQPPGETLPQGRQDRRSSEGTVRLSSTSQEAGHRPGHRGLLLSARPDAHAGAGPGLPGERPWESCRPAGLNAPGHFQGAEGLALQLGA